MNGIKSQIHAVPGGMDGEKFSPSGAASVYDLITVGNLIPRKRVDIFLHTVALLKASCPTIKAIILGDGPLRQSLENTVKELNIEENVYFAGHQPNVEDWLRNSKIFVLSSMSEGLSQALIQAMLCGLPAISSNVGEASDLVITGVNGFLVDDFSEESFAENIAYLLRDQKVLAQFSEKARKQAEKCDEFQLALSWDNILSKLN